MSVQSQLDPLPSDLPFRIVSKTIGRGAYASIKKAIPSEGATPVFAVKFIHKAYAVKHGRVTAKQIAMEVTLHAHVGQHQNVIEFFASGEDPVWRWIAMEYAEGGDLFDKIEADVGVSEDIAHFYFTQLMSGVAWMHSKGVGHRDIKPENILLSSNGDLKLADFGLATLFVYKGKRKESATMCGSPPYIAPEVISCSGSGIRSKATHGGYAGDRIDIWSCGVVLFVLLVGNTPWDQPTAESYEYTAYSSTNGKSSTDELWQKPPPAVLSLLRGMMKIDPSTRYTSQEVRRHPWFTRSNPYLSSDGSGRSGSAIHLATKLLESLKIDMSQEPAPSPQANPHHKVDTMDIDDFDDPASHRFAATQPDTPLHDLTFDFDPLPAHISASTTAHDRFGGSSSQPVIATTASTTTTLPLLQNGPSPLGSRASHLTHAHPYPSVRHPTLNTPATGTGNGNASLADLPSMSQFSQNTSLPLTLTQHAQRFQDIVPAHSLTRFLSHLPRSSLLSLLSEVLHNLGIPCPPPRELPATASETTLRTRSKGPTWLRIRTVDSRKCPIAGDIVVESTGILKDGYESREGGAGEEDAEGELLECRFVKVKGDPVEWRRLFKKVCLAGKEGVWVPEEGTS